MASRSFLVACIAVVLASGDARAEDAPSAPADDSAPAPPLPALPVPASGAPAPPAAAPSASPAQTEDDRLQRFLEVRAAADKRGRISSAVVHGVLAAVLIPPGVVLVTKDDVGLQVAGVTILIQGAWRLVFFPTTLMAPAPMEKLFRYHEEKAARGEAPADRTAETEREWQKGIAEQHSASVWNAIWGLSLGSLEVAAGMYLLLQKPTLGFDRQDQTVWGTVFLGASLPGFGLGIVSLFGASSMEDEWELYQAGKPAPSAGLAPAVNLVPIRGGMAGALHFAF